MSLFFDCLGKTPFASLLAALMVIIGTSVFCGTSFRALQIIIAGVFNDLFGFSVNWLEILQTMFVVIGVVMGAFAIILLVFGFLATGATRSNIYSGAKCIMGGRITAAFFMFTSYILTIGWLAILSVYMASVLAYAAMDSICSKEIYSRTAKELQDINYCFNLTRFGLYSINMGSDHLCQHTQLRSMCNKVTEAGPLFCVAFAAIGLVIIGMIHFIVTLAANYTRIKISKEVTEYRDAIETEEIAFHSAEKIGPPPYSSGVTTFMFTSYILTIGWLAILSVYMASVLAYAAMDSICSKEIYSRTAKELQDINYCFNLTRFGLYSINMGSDHLCQHTQLRSMCNKVTEAGPLFCVAFAAIGLVIIGMIHFIVTLAANYTRIKISKEVTEYRDAIETEEIAFHSAEKIGPPPYSSGVTTV